MNTKYLLLQLFLLISVFVNLFIDKNLFLKVLLLLLLFLYGLLILTDFKHNRERYLFSATGYVVISLLFLFVRYIPGTTYVLFLSCLLVIFIYLSRVLFASTYGIVIESTNRYAIVKIKDDLYNYGQKHTIKTTKKYIVGSIVLIGLDRSILRKPKEIIRVLETSEFTKKPTGIRKITKKRSKTNNKSKK